MHGTPFGRRFTWDNLPGLEVVDAASMRTAPGSPSEVSKAAMAEDRLSQISTIWTTISSAHSPGQKSQEAMQELVSRYHDAVTRYIYLKVRDKHLADEVLQEFWTKLLTGKLAGADKSKGRFRDYLRTVLHRLMIDRFRTRKHQSCRRATCSTPAGPTKISTVSGAKPSSSASGLDSKPTRR